jgi:hypothetical protein
MHLSTGGSSSAGSMRDIEFRLHPDLHDGGGYSRHRQGGGAPRAILENPGMRGQSKITTSLYAGIQLVMPGESLPYTATASRRRASCWRAAPHAAGRRSPCPPFGQDRRWP